eukprot:792864-Pleurochrysis_carterae.AAC.1
MAQAKAAAEEKKKATDARLEAETKTAAAAAAKPKRGARGNSRKKGREMDELEEPQSVPIISLHSPPAASPARAPPPHEPSQNILEMRARLAKYEEEEAEE